MGTARDQQIPNNRKGTSDLPPSAKKEAAGCCDHATNGECPDAACRIEAVVTVDARGQLVLPKEVRARAGIGAGEKMIVLGWEREGKVCCITLVKSGLITEKVREFVHP